MSSSMVARTQARGKGILRGPPPGFPLKEPLEVPQHSLVTRMTNLPRTQWGTLPKCSYRLDCPRFDRSNFRG